MLWCELDISRPQRWPGQDTSITQACEALHCLRAWSWQHDWDVSATPDADTSLSSGREVSISDMPRLLVPGG
jgi:hypothetical protein